MHITAHLPPSFSNLASHAAVLYRASMRLVPALFCAFLLACSGRSSSSSSSSGDSNPLPDASMPPLQVRLLITLGSSSTAGTGASSTDTRYTNLLAQRLNARLINLGTGGQTVEAVQQTYLPQALAALDAMVAGCARVRGDAGGPPRPLLRRAHGRGEPVDARRVAAAGAGGGGGGERLGEKAAMRAARAGDPHVAP